MTCVLAAALAALHAAGHLHGDVSLPYASPDVLSGQWADEADDVWSLCVVLYEMVAGEHPFAGGGAEEVSQRIRRRRRPGIIFRADRSVAGSQPSLIVHVGINGPMNPLNGNLRTSRGRVHRAHQSDSCLSWKPSGITSGLPLLALLAVSLSSTALASSRAPTEIFRGSAAPAHRPPSFVPRSSGVGSSATIKLALPTEREESEMLRRDRPSTVRLSQAIGFGRDLAQLRGAAPGSADLVWETLPDGGRAASLVLVSTGAEAIRAQLEISKAHDALEVQFYSPVNPEKTVERVPASELRVTRSPQGQGYTYWSPTVSGDRIAMEFYFPAGVEPRLSVTIPRVSHFVEHPLERISVAPRCSGYVDVACEPDAVSQAARHSVAKYTRTRLRADTQFDAPANSSTTSTTRPKCRTS